MNLQALLHMQYHQRMPIVPGAAKTRIRIVPGRLRRAFPPVAVDLLSKITCLKALG
jgi:hypothetical protein